MLAIQTVTTNIKNKHLVDKENNSLVGEKLDLKNVSNIDKKEDINENKIGQGQSEEIEEIESNDKKYILSEELKTKLSNIENSELYILSQEDLESHGIKNTKVDNTSFFIVDYNTEEIYYSLGIEGTYSLSEL